MSAIRTALNASTILRGAPLRGVPGVASLSVEAPMALVGVGDSIIKGDGADEFLPIVGAAIGANVVNLGVNGQSWNYDWAGDPGTTTMIQDAPTVGTYAAAGNYLVAFAGSNGQVLGGNTPAQEYADFETWLAATLAEGWTAGQIIVCTMLPRTGISFSFVTEYNNLLGAGVETYGYRLARFDREPTMGASGADLNTTYYSDGTHPTTAGHALLAPVVEDAINDAFTAPATVKWDGYDHSEFITVTADYMTGTVGDTATRNTNSGPWRSARAYKPLPAGTTIVNFTVDALGTGQRLGVGNAAASVDTFIGVDTNSLGAGSDGNFLYNSGFVGDPTNMGSFTTGDVIGMEYSSTAETVRFRKNGGSWCPTISTTPLGSTVYVMATLGEIPSSVSVTSL